MLEGPKQAERIFVPLMRRGRHAGAQRMSNVVCAVLGRPQRI